MLTKSTNSSALPITAHAGSERTRQLLRLFALDALVGAVTIAGAAIARIGIEQVVGGVAPFVLTFPAIMLATLLRGGRAGTIAAVGCQMLAIRYVFPNWIAPHGGISTDLANMLLSTAALGATLWATQSYRRTAVILRSRCERQVHTLSLLVAEIDHRTKNNFQIAAGLLAHQSLTAGNSEIATELERASLRLETIASVYQNLSNSAYDKEQVELADHLGQIIALLRAGATPESVAINYRGDQVTVSVETAIITGLIVNEWITNALKHAFGGRVGEISVEVLSRTSEIEVVVSDNGGAAPLTNKPSRGSDLMVSLAEVIHATMRTDLAAGMRRVLILPTGQPRQG